MLGGDLGGCGAGREQLARLGVVGKVGRGRTPEQVLVNGHAPSVPGRADGQDTAPQPGKRPDDKPLPGPSGARQGLRDAVLARRDAAGAWSRSRGSPRAGDRPVGHLRRVPVERRLAQATWTRSAMPFSAALPQLRGS
ncbi:hypothetical protein TPA0909_48690 [Streptomyces albus]|nr:hypothetical protein TPA0909_48690 [Streptomyces albus]